MTITFYDGYSTTCDYIWLDVNRGFATLTDEDGDKYLVKLTRILSISPQPIVRRESFVELCDYEFAHRIVTA